MKRIIFALMTAIMLCTLAQGKNRTVTENDSLGNPKRVIELKDTMINGKSVTDTLSIMTYENSTHRHTESDNDYKSRNDAYDFGWNIGHNTREAIIAIVAIVSVFGLPLVVVFIVFFFRYKNRKAKYRLAEQALASGQPLPEHLFKDTESIDTRSKGIKNVFAGIGLFIFFGPLPANSDWAASDCSLCSQASDKSSSTIRNSTKPPKATGNPIIQKQAFRKRMKKNEPAQ